MSSAVPIHPMLRLARKNLSSYVINNTAFCSARIRSISISSPALVRPSSKKLAGKENDSKKGILAAPLGSSQTPTASSSSSTPPPAKKSNDATNKVPIDSLAMASYAASPPPSNVKMTDKRSMKARKEVEESAEAVEMTKDATASTGFKVSKGASLHPAAVEQDRQASVAAASAPESSRRRDSSKTDSQTNRPENGTKKLAEGIIIPAAHASASDSPLSLASDQASVASQPPLSSSSTVFNSSDNRSDISSNSNLETEYNTNREETNARSGPPAATQVTELGNNIRPSNPMYPFDTHVFIKRLQEAKFVPKPVDKGAKREKGDEPETSLSAVNVKRHDPAEAIMEATRHLIVTRGGRVIDQNISKTEVDNQAYLFTAALSELRTELQVRARNDAAALRSMVTLLQREVDSLNQKMREDVAGMKHDIQVDMNNRKGEAKEEGNTLEQEIQDLNNRFTISISDLKTEIEQDIKWDATRRALTVVFGTVVILIASLAAADHLTREDVEEIAHRKGSEANKMMHDASSQTKPKSAEEIGLVANYDDHDGSRYV